LETIKARYTPPYASLEQLDGKEAEPCFDMWALGVLIFRMLVGEEPFPFMRDTLVSEAIKNNNRKPIPDHYSSDLRKIVDSILVIEPHKRLTAD
jgi:serine/threonine protein kinase